MKPLEDGLEGMIETGRIPKDNTPVGAYLKANPAAREEVAAMMDLSRLIRENFTVSSEELETLEPSPGFYARVLARIESQAAPPSIWNFFLEPLGMRLVYASLGLAALLFTAALMDSTPVEAELASTESMQVMEGPSSPTTVHGAFLASDTSGVPVVESTNPDEDRGAALMQLTTYDQ
jgi:hypothetical protein